MFHVAAGSKIVGTRLDKAAAHLLAFRTHLARSGDVEVRVIHTGSDRVTERFERCSK